MKRLKIYFLLTILLFMTACSDKEEILTLENEISELKSDAERDGIKISNLNDEVAELQDYINQLTKSTQIVFLNELGNPIKEEYYNKYGVFDGIKNYSYDINGKLLSEKFYDKNEVLKYEKTLEYNVESARYKYKNYSEDGKLMSETYHDTYDNPIKSIHYDNDIIKAKIFWEYDKGNLISATYYDGEDQLSGYVNYIYNDDGVLSEVENYNENYLFKISYYKITNELNQIDYIEYYDEEGNLSGIEYK